MHSVFGHLVRLEPEISPDAELEASSTTICEFPAKNLVSSGTQTSPNDPKIENASAKLHLLNWVAIPLIIVDFEWDPSICNCQYQTMSMMIICHN